jgi:ATPase subunit of ABC transporter with duplicated ATPase domains
MASKKLTPEQQFEITNFAKREDIIALLPRYRREQLSSRKALPKNVNIPDFTMKSPYGDKVLLQNTELTLEPNRRQALFGPNSSGKTVLFMNIVNGEIQGFPTHLSVHHCKELEEHELGDTVLNTVIKSNPYLNILLKIEAKMKTLLENTAQDKKVLEDLKTNFEFVTSQINSIGGKMAEDKAKKMLRVLGFDEVGQAKLVNELSGGLKMRVALCMAFFIEADLLLMDEPTNHLDFPSVLWLENRLRSYKGSFLLVTHDRELLKNVCTGVLMIDELQIKYYNMVFPEFEKKRDIEAKKKYEEIEKFCKKYENSDPCTQIGRQRLDKKAWADNYHQKLVALQSKFTFPPPVALSLPEGVDPATPQSEVSLINLQDVVFSYNLATGHYIFQTPISFNVRLGTRVGVMGPNGAGKSTFLKLLTHKLKATSGSVIHHPNFKLAYFGQHSTAELDMEATAMSFMQEAFPKYNVGQLRQHLGKTGIVGPIADTRIKGLSYSQRSCVIFAKLTLESPHLLILDEPTNFLDLESVDSLISACNKYKGALLLVSHNRDFLKKCAKQFLSIVPGRFELYDDLKTAEKATYTFIQEMEAGGKISGKTAILENPGGGSIHSSQKAGATTTSTATTPAPVVVAVKKAIEIPSSAAPAETKPATTAAGSENNFEVNEKVQAKFSEDGRWYNAVVRGIKADLYNVYYVDYGNSEFVPISSLRKFIAKDAVKGKPVAQNNQKQAVNNRTAPQQRSNRLDR